jgi:hypothetical protein
VPFVAASPQNRQRRHEQRAHRDAGDEEHADDASY